MIDRRGRCEVLHALALVAGSGEPLDRGLAGLAAGDPLLEPWLRRLAPDLAAGQPVEQVLRHHRLIRRDEVAVVAASNDLPATLRRLAAASPAVPLRAKALRWLPVTLTLALGGGMLVGSAVLNLAGMQPLHDLNIRLPLGHGSASSWLALFVLIAAVSAALAGTMAAIDAIPGVRRLLHLWCPEVQRSLALAELVRALATQRRAAALRHWRTWWFLTRWRLPYQLRNATAADPDAEQRLAALGVLPLRQGSPDWETAVATADARLAGAVGAAGMLIGPLLWGCLLCGFFFGVSRPLLMITDQLNGGF
jgi:hypothetical protein